MLKQATKEALILLLASIGIASVVFLIRPDHIGPVSAPEKMDGFSQGAMDGQILEISLEEAVQRFNAGSALFVDSRHRADFEAGHIQGAVNLFLADQGDWLAGFLDSTDPATVIVTYCDGEECHLAPELAEFLFFNGFDNVRYLKNGWSRWQKGRYPTGQ